MLLPSAACRRQQGAPIPAHVSLGTKTSETETFAPEAGGHPVCVGDDARAGQEKLELII